MTRIRIPNDWRPRPYQRPLWDYLESGGKRAVAVWHRRSGKDDVDLHWTAVAAHQRIGTYWYLLPQATQARKAIWEAVNPHTGKRRIDEAFPQALRARTRENEMFIRFQNGSTWQVVGSDRYDALVGAPPVGVVFSEWALSDPQAWAYMRPIMAENGGWALFNYTPRGRNHGLTTLETAKTEPSWFGEVLTVEQTGVFTPEILDQERRELILEHGDDFGEALFQQEYFCSFQAAVIGAYYGREMVNADSDGRIGKVPWEPSVPVDTAWDLGIGDSTAIWFCQRVAKEWRLIDYIENNSVGLDWYVKELRERPYVYGEHILPHDAEVRSLNDGKTRVETLHSLGLTQTKTLPRRRLEEGTNAARLVLPRCWFDAVKCAKGIEALRSYRRNYDQRLKVFSDQPLHDWASHAADAFRYLAQGLDAERFIAAQNTQPRVHAGPGGWMT